MFERLFNRGPKDIATRRKEAAEKFTNPKFFTEKDHADVESLRAPLRKILEDLRPKIEKGEYTIVLADDASGRIPAFIIGHVLKTVYEHKGFPAQHFRTVAGSMRVQGDLKRNKSIALREQFGKMKQTMLDHAPEQATGRILIVTDTVNSGQSVELPLRSLRANGLEADVATLSIMSSSEDVHESKRKYFEEKWDTTVVSASHTFPDIYHTRLSGVTKKDDKVFATPNDTPHEVVRASRHYAKQIAEDLAKEFLNKK